MGFNFDEVIDRRNTNSIKYDFMRERGKAEDLIPLWVADMDFKVPDEVTMALARAVEHGIFGYSDSRADYFNAVHRWHKDRFNYDIKEEWLVKSPGIVFALATAIKAFTEKGDGVIIQQPVYYPFSGMILNNERRVVNNPLIYKDGKYYMDFDDFEEKVIRENVKLFILCSPHNPIGRVWTEEELVRLGDICLRHNVIVVSDEIHADFIYGNNKHSIFSGIRPEYLNNTVLCTSPSKTFNMPGLQVSNIFIANKKLRLKFSNEIRKTGYSHLNTLGLVACTAAYEHGAPWLEALKDYLWENVRFVGDFLSSQIPRVKLVEPEGTYLLWLDFSALGLGDDELEELIEKKAGLWLNPGRAFGTGGQGFQRLNIACPRQVLDRALAQLKQAIDS
ncbi:MAG TPA: MalY/PatB family protein [Clostridia bacterium]|nr:MalY/PatB family protein [Clostridia bacterium]